MKFLKDRKGFTFLEVIVAVAIIAIVFTASLKMVSRALALRSVSRFYSLAPYLASDVAGRLEKEGFMGSELSGDFGDEFNGWSWKADITKMQGEGTLAWMEIISRIDIAVRYGPENLDHHLVFYRVSTRSM